MIDRQNPTFLRVQKEYINFLKASKRQLKEKHSLVVDLPNWELTQENFRDKNYKIVRKYYYQIDINGKLFKILAEDYNINDNNNISDEAFLANKMLKLAQQMANILEGEVIIKTIGYSYNNQYNIADQMEFRERPCTEYKRLVAWLNKHGIQIKSEWDVYTVRLFGKRGYYNESGTKRYLCHMPEKCLALLNELKEKVQYGDRLKISELQELDDVEDMEYSIKYETECYGSRYTYYKITDYFKTKDKVRTVIDIIC